jgi:hypothetical protein
MPRNFPGTCDTNEDYPTGLTASDACDDLIWNLRSEAARIDWRRLQIVRDWVHKFNVHRLKGLIARSPRTQRSRFMEQHRRH